MVRKWTKETVIEAIHLRHANGLPLKNMLLFDKPLYRAAHFRFGGWPAALIAAGLDSKPFRRWSKERIIQELRAYYRLPSIYRRQKGNLLLSAAYRYFGSLRAAREAAGIDIPPRKWSPQRVIEAIQDRHIRGLPIVTACWRKNLSLANAAKRYFGTWEDALVAAGLLLNSDRPRPKRRWTRTRVLAAIRARHEQGLPLQGVRNDDGGLDCAVAKHFGGWQKALLAMGLESKPRQHWTKQKIVAAIRARAQQNLLLTSIEKFDSALASAARWHFGGWRKAVRAAGYQIIHRNKIQEIKKPRIKI